MAFVEDESKFQRHGPAVKSRYRDEGGNPRLFLHQIDALQSLEKWFTDIETSKITAVVVMPTGSGKTGVICCLPYTLGVVARNIDGLDLQRPILIVSPDLAIQEQLEINLHPVKHAKAGEAFLLKRKIVPEEFRRSVMPRVKKVTSPSELRVDILESHEIILANAQKWHIRPTKAGVLWEDLKEDTFSIVIVDEAHHLPAPQWKRIIDKFSTHAKIVFLTATPYRTDGMAISDDIEQMGLAYHLKLTDAIRRNIIRETEFIELHENVRDREDANSQILHKVADILDLKNRQHPLPGRNAHVAIAAAQDKDDADNLACMWNDYNIPGITAAAYHSGLKENDRERIMKRLKDGELKLLVIVAMLLEGFDYPPISVAAIATGIKSPVKFAQFIGRAQRLVRFEGETEHKGKAHIVTHRFYKQSKNYQKFKQEILIPVRDEDESSEG